MNTLDKLISKRLLVAILSILLLNIYFISSIDVIAVVAFVEFVILILVLIFNGCKQFLLLLLVFTSISFDVPQFVDTSTEVLYSVSNLRFFGFTGLFLLILLAFVLYLTQKSSKLISSNDKLRYLYRFTVYVIFTGIVMALLSFLINDNRIPQHIFVKFFRNDFVKYFSTCVLIILYILQITNDSMFYKQLKQYLFTTLVSIIVASIISVLSGFVGHYGDSEIILMPLSFFYSTCIILFFMDRNYRKNNKVLLLFCSIIAFYLQFFYSNALSGKSWLVLVFIFSFLYARYNYNKFNISATVIMTIAIIIGGFTVNNFATSNAEDNLMSKKINEAISLLAFSQISYYDNISDSPKARIDEFINVLDEFKNKPLLSVFGKGFGGSIKDHNNTFGYFNGAYFSDDEYIHNSFVFLHESINVILLKFGLFGLTLFFLLILKIVKTGFLSPWLFIGIIWLIFFFGYTFSLSIFGLSSLVLGLYEESLIKERG